MKKLIAFITLAVMVSSCGNHFTLMKRQYTKGYYVQRNDHLSATAEIKNKQISSKPSVTPHLLLSDPGVKDVQAKLNHSVMGDVKEKKSMQSSLKMREREKVVAVHLPKITLNRDQRGFLDQPNADSRSGGGDVNILLLVLLSIFIPPLAVYLKNGETNKWFWATLILCLLAFTYFIFVFGGSLWFAAFVIAILYVLDIIK